MDRRITRDKEGKGSDGRSPAQCFRISSHTVALDLKSSSSPLSTATFVELEEPRRSDDRPMADVSQAGKEANAENVDGGTCSIIRE